MIPNNSIKKEKKSIIIPLLVFLIPVIIALGSLYYDRLSYLLEKTRIPSEKDLTAAHEKKETLSIDAVTKQNKYQKNHIKSIRAVNFNLSYYQPKIDSNFFIKYNLNIDNSGVNSNNINITFSGKLEPSSEYENYFYYAGGNLVIYLDNKLCVVIDSPKIDPPRIYGLGKSKMDNHIRTEIDSIFIIKFDFIMKKINQCLIDNY